MTFTLRVPDLFPSASSLRWRTLLGYCATGAAMLFLVGILAGVI